MKRYAAAPQYNKLSISLDCPCFKFHFSCDCCTLVSTFLHCSVDVFFFFPVIIHAQDTGVLYNTPNYTSSGKKKIIVMNE